MKTTMTLAANMNCTPFVLFDQDTDEIIMVLNFYVGLSQLNNSNAVKHNFENHAVKKNDGFWDM